MITPSKLKTVLQKLGISPESLNDMTQKEKQKIYQDVLKILDADSLINLIPLGSESNLNVLSVNRGNITYKSKVHIYSRQKESLIWNDTLEAIIHLGGRRPNEGEINTAVVSALAEKILEVTGKAEKKA